MNYQEIYQETAVKTLMKEFGIKNKQAVPKLEKIVINVGLKEAASNKGVLDKVAEQITVITGQNPR